MCMYMCVRSIQGKRCCYRQQQPATTAITIANRWLFDEAPSSTADTPNHSEPNQQPSGLQPTAYSHHMQQPPQQQREHWKLLTWWKFQRKLRIKKSAQSNEGSEAVKWCTWTKRKGGNKISTKSLHQAAAKAKQKYTNGKNRARR